MPRGQGAGVPGGGRGGRRAGAARGDRLKWAARGAWQRAGGPVGSFCQGGRWLGRGGRWLGRGAGGWAEAAGGWVEVPVAGPRRPVAGPRCRTKRAAQVPGWAASLLGQWPSARRVATAKWRPKTREVRTLLGRPFCFLGAGLPACPGAFRLSPFPRTPGPKTPVSWSPGPSSSPGPARPLCRSGQGTSPGPSRIRWPPGAKAPPGPGGL